MIHDYSYSVVLALGTGVPYVQNIVFIRYLLMCLYIIH